MPYYLVIFFPTVLHFLRYSDLSYWLQHTLYSQVHHSSSITSAGPSFYPPPNAELIDLFGCLFERWTELKVIHLDHFINPFLLLRSQWRPERSCTLPKVTQHTCGRDDLHCQNPSPGSFSWWYMPTSQRSYKAGWPLYVNSTSSSKQAVHCIQLGQSRAFLAIFWRTYSPFLSLLLLKFQKVTDTSNSLHPHSVSILGCIPVFCPP